MSDSPIPPQVGYRPPPGPVSTGLAVTTLVLGILSLVLLCPLLGIVPIITGIIALMRTSSQPQRYGGRGLAIGGLICGAASFVVAPMMIAILLPSLSRARELSKRLVCQSNMKGIALTIEMYQMDFPDQGIPSLDFLVAEEYLTPERTLCPSADISESNYVILPAEHWGPDAGDRAVVMYEPKSNHADEGGNVVYADGHAEFLRGEDYDEMLRSLPVRGP